MAASLSLLTGTLDKRSPETITLPLEVVQRAAENLVFFEDEVQAALAKLENLTFRRDIRAQLQVIYRTQVRLAGARETWKDFAALAPDRPALTVLDGGGEEK